MRQTHARWTSTRSWPARGSSRSRRRRGATANSGTRFHVYPWPGAARDVHERIADAALVHRLTGCCPTRRAPHPVGPRSTTAASCAATPRSSGIRIGAINPNLFGDDDYRLGSLCHPDARRPRAGARALPRVRRDRGSRSARPILSLWLADGTNYPGQDDLRDAPRASRRRARGAVRAAAGRACGCSSSTSSSSRRFYSTDLPDWGTAALRLPAPRPAGAGARRHRPPSAGDEHRADRRAPARGGAARRLPLQQPQVRRRRPDRRRDRPVRAVPDHARDRARGPDAEQRGAS